MRGRDRFDTLGRSRRGLCRFPMRSDGRAAVVVDGRIERVTDCLPPRPGHRCTRARRLGAQPEADAHLALNGRHARLPRLAARRSIWRPAYRMQTALHLRGPPAPREQVRGGRVLAAAVGKEGTP